MSLVQLELKCSGQIILKMPCNLMYSARFFKLRTWIKVVNHSDVNKELRKYVKAMSWMNSQRVLAVVLNREYFHQWTNDSLLCHSSTLSMYSQQVRSSRYIELYCVFYSRKISELYLNSFQSTFQSQTELSLPMKTLCHGTQIYCDGFFTALTKY